MTEVKYFPMLGQYKGERMGMVININNGIEELGLPWVSKLQY